MEDLIKSMSLEERSRLYNNKTYDVSINMLKEEEKIIKSRENFLRAYLSPKPKGDGYTLNKIKKYARIRRTPEKNVDESIYKDLLYNNERKNKNIISNKKDDYNIDDKNNIELFSNKKKKNKNADEEEEIMLIDREKIPEIKNIIISKEEFQKPKRRRYGKENETTKINNKEPTE